MTQGKHTPGPWDYRFGDICGPDDKDGDDLVLASVGTSYGLRSSRYSVVRKGQEMEANARLIAAAPDLLEALKACRLELSYCKDQLAASGYESRDGGSVMEALRIGGAAIAKAEGLS